MSLENVGRKLTICATGSDIAAEPRLSDAIAAINVTATAAAEYPNEAFRITERMSFPAVSAACHLTLRRHYTNTRIGISKDAENFDSQLISIPAVLAELAPQDLSNGAFGQAL
jgi:hypothetical protein